MEPGQQRLSGRLEKVPLPSPEYGVTSPESSPERGGERTGERRPEAAVVQAEASQIAMPSLPAPVLPGQAVQQSATDDDIPSVAGDDDLIEKEWVDKAKKILADTRDDPYRREREISKLQIEYIRRRYGREIGDTGD